jgi:hypothetical protein
LDEVEFEEHMAAEKQAGRELTTAGVLRLAAKRAREAKGETESEPGRWSYDRAASWLNKKIEHIAKRWPSGDSSLAQQLRDLADTYEERGVAEAA